MLRYVLLVKALELTRERSWWEEEADGVIYNCD